MVNNLFFKKNSTSTSQFLSFSKIITFEIIYTLEVWILLVNDETEDWQSPLSVVP